MDLEVDRLSQLPKEIWTRILEYVLDRDSIVSCYYTCSSFRCILERRIMAEALLVMQHHLVKADHNRRKRDALTKPSVVLSQELLQCRRVCRSWKHSVDKFLEIHPYHHNNPHGYMTVDASIFSFHSHYPTFKVNTKPKSIDRIQELSKWYRLRNHRRLYQRMPIPFPGRRLRVNVEHAYNYRMSSQLIQPTRFRTVLLECLGVNGIGDQIYHFEYCSDLIAGPVWYEMVYDCFKLMPNLRTFCLSLYSRSDFEPPNRPMLVECQKTQFADFVKCTSFPELQQLVTVHVKEAPSSFVDSLLHINKSVQKLSLEHVTGDDYWLTDMRSDNLPKLMDFSIGENFILRVPHLSQFNWPLTKLTIGDKNMNIRRLIRNNFVSETFSFLKKFRSTLKILHMNVYWPEVPDPTARLPELPHLEELGILFTEKVNLNFILPLFSLKILKVDIESRTFDRHDAEELIQFNGCIDRLQESNLWEQLMHLKIVQVSIFSNVVEPGFILYTHDRRQKYTYIRDGKAIIRKRKRYFSSYL